MEAGGLEAVYQQYRAELLRFLTARTGQAAEAEDVMQEMWLRLQGGASGPVAHPRAYLYRMGQNLVLDRRREAERRERRDKLWVEMAAGAEATGDMADARPDALEAMLEREEAAQLASAIANLPEGAGRAFRLHKIDGLSHGEVASRMGISRSGVEKHMAVAMKYLRRALAED